MNHFPDAFAPSPNDLAIREAIKKAIRASGKSRQQIASELAARLGRSVTVRMLDDFTAPSKERSRFPASWIAAFCDITSNRALQRLLVDPEIDAALKVIEFARQTVRESKSRA